MFRNSSFLALALAVTALGSATIPVAARPSAHPGSMSVSLPAKMPIPTSAGIRPAHQSIIKPSESASSLPSAGSHPGPFKVMKVGAQDPQIAGSKPTPLKIPTNAGKDSVGTAQIAGLFPQPLKVPAGNPPTPPTPPAPPTPTPTPTPSTVGNPGPIFGGNGITIYSPPTSVGAAVSSAGGVAGANLGSSFAQARPPATSGARGCANIPALAATIDALLPTAQLAPSDITKVTVMRELIQDLAASGKDASARDVEEVAMHLLGFDKLWLRCGYGTFTWVREPNTTAAIQAQ